MADYNRDYDGPKQHGPTPWLSHAFLGAATFMIAHDRTKTLKGGLVGLGIAAGFAAARYLTTPDERSPYYNTVNSVWGALEFSAITSPLGASLMRGGSLYRPIGKKIQRAFSVGAYKKMVGLLPEDMAGEYGKYKSLHGAVRNLGGTLRAADAQVAQTIQTFAEEKAGAKGFISKTGLGILGGSATKIAEGSSRLVRRYSGIAEKYLRGIAAGPRGPYEALSGAFDVSERILQATENPQKEVAGAVGAFMGPRWSWASGGVEKIMSRYNLLGSSYDSIESLKKSGAYKASKVLIRNRKFLEATIGAPSIGEQVKRYGSISRVPLPQYAWAHIQDTFYGAAPGVVLASPFMVYGIAKYHYNKIIGHHPGRMTAQTEEDTKSDFRAGHSYDPRPGSPGWTGRNSYDNVMRYVSSHPFSSGIVYGPGIPGKKEPKKIPPQIVAAGFIDDALLIMFRLALRNKTKARWGSNQAYEKIVGHQPSATNFHFDSDFTPGMSYDPKAGSPGGVGRMALHLFNDEIRPSIKSGMGIWESIDLTMKTPGGIRLKEVMKGRLLSNIPRALRRGLTSSILAGSLLFGGNAQADSIVHVHSREMVSQRYQELSGLVDRVTNPGDIWFKKQLMETAIHESWGLRHSRQLTRDFFTGKFTESGVGRSIFMIEPTTAVSMIKWARRHPAERDLLSRSSGRPYSDLLLMPKHEVSNLLMNNDFFAANMARVKYLSTKFRPSADINVRASEWSKYYQGTNNSKERLQYIEDTRRMSRQVRNLSKDVEASSIARVFRPHVGKLPVHGGINQVIHNNRHEYGSKVSSARKKLSFMSKALRRV